MICVGASRWDALGEPYRLAMFPFFKKKKTDEGNENVPVSEIPAVAEPKVEAPTQNKPKLTTQLSKPKSGWIAPLKSLFGAGPKKTVRELIPQIEEVLISADCGVPTTLSLINELEAATHIKTEEEVFDFLKKRIVEILTPKTEFVLPTQKPVVIYMVGVNGVGKTTTIGKLASHFKEKGLKVLLVAADTFRAAAKEQLEVWSSRNDVDFVGGQANADPASVIFDGLKAAKARGVDLVFVDTAGRLHTKTGLMDELQKMVRICEKEMGRNPDEIFLVLDATTGQNGLSQAKTFGSAVPLTGLVLTKLDGTARGGILLSVASETGLPLRFVGVGEAIEDLRPFEATSFTEALFAN